MCSPDGGWKETALACTVCGKPEAFPTNTRWGMRHDCRGCGRWAWGYGPFRNQHEHNQASRITNDVICSPSSEESDS